MIAEYGLISSIVNLVAGKDDPQNLMTQYNQVKALYNGPNSISKKAKQGIFEFPFLISSNIESIDDITDIIKTMEIEYSNMVAISMGLNPSTKYSENYEINRTLSSFHTNSNDYGFSYDENGGNGLFESKSISDFLTTEAVFETTKKEPDKEPKKDPNATDDEKNILKNTPIAYSYSAGKIAERYTAKYNMTMIKVKLRLGTDKNSEIEIPIGIRGIPHPVRHDDLAYIMSSFIKTRVGGVLNRFIRWKTGEIKGLHNLLFRYDEIKKDAEFERRVGTDSSWLSVLKSRANNRKVNLLTKIFSSGKIDTNDILPNCTFILNLTDIDNIENITSINLFTNVRAAKKFLDDSMGLGLCILDEAHNTIHILYSGWDKYESRNVKSLKSKDNTKDEMNALLTLMKKANGGLSI